MNDKADEVTTVSLTRDEIRAALLGKTPDAKSVLITVFGVELELKQPSLGSIMETRENDDAIAVPPSPFVRVLHRAAGGSFDDKIFGNNMNDIGIVPTACYGQFAQCFAGSRLNVNKQTIDLISC